MEPDFSGWATKAGLKCSDGRTILPDAFKHQDQVQVPLVWQHGHTDPENVLGHAILSNRAEGVWADCYFNNSPKAKHMKEAVDHKDIRHMSIWANELIERAKRVYHGVIREVSLVLSGANPGATIESITIRHSDGEVDTLEDEAIIHTGLEFEVPEVEEKKDEVIEHAAPSTDLTIQDVYDSMTEQQKAVLHYMVGEALQSAAGDTVQQDAMQHGDVVEVDDDASKEDKQEVVPQDEIKHSDTDSEKEGTSKMSRNVFEQDAPKVEGAVLSHSDVRAIVEMAAASSTGSLKAATRDYALSHGIENIDTLFPDATNLYNTPEWNKRRTEWVDGVLSGVSKRPFSRIRTMSADITLPEARARGYVKGSLKKEEFFSVTKRVTTPTTIYKKQKLDRDDIIDITDFDVVVWMKGEMRVMLDEELARAILLGDGREVDDEDKINETNIRPIAKDHELYTTVVNVNIDDAQSSVQEIIDAILLNRRFYKGSGLPTMYTTETYITKFMMLKDQVDRRIYANLGELANELRVSSIVPVEVMEEYSDIVCVLVNLVDYALGADSGGAVNLFDDFDIDYNQYKYLIETRCSGALTKLKAAIVVKKVAGTDVLATPAAPTFDPDTGEITIVNTTGVVYKRSDTDATVNAAGSPYTVAAGKSLGIYAVPATGYYFASSEVDNWVFTHEA